MLLIYINALKHSCFACTELCTYFSRISVLQLKAKEQKFIFCSILRMCYLRTKPRKFCPVSEGCRGGIYPPEKPPQAQGGEGSRAGGAPGGSLEGPQGALALPAKPRQGWVLILERFSNQEGENKK